MSTDSSNLATLPLSEPETPCSTGWNPARSSNRSGPGAKLSDFFRDLYHFPERDADLTVGGSRCSDKRPASRLIGRYAYLRAQLSSTNAAIPWDCWRGGSVLCDGGLVPALPSCRGRGICGPRVRYRWFVDHWSHRSRSCLGSPIGRRAARDALYAASSPPSDRSTFGPSFALTRTRLPSERRCRSPATDGK